MAVFGGGERDLTIKLLADVDNFKKNMDKASGETKTFGDKVNGVMKTVGTAVVGAAAAAGAFAIKFGIDAVKAASNLQETLSKVNVIFGDSAREVEAFADKAATGLGQSRQQALDASATFAIFGKSAGLAGTDLVKFSTDFTALAADLASFNNTTPEQAINAIGAALRGEAEPLRAYGVLLNDATLKQAALELGIISTTNEALTPQARVLAAQKVIYEQTADAQGDFARTSDGLANQTKILQARLEDVTAEIGTALLPIATDLAEFFGNDVVPIIERFGNLMVEDIVPAIKTNVIPAFENLIETLNRTSTVFGETSDAAEETKFTFSDLVFGNTGIIVSFTRATEFLVAFGATTIDVLNRVRAFIQGDMDTALREWDNRFRQNAESVNNVNDAMVRAYQQAEFYRNFTKTEATPTVDQNTEALLKQSEALKKQIAELEKGTNSTNRLSAAQSNLKSKTDEVNRSLKEQFTALEALDLLRAGFGSAIGGNVGIGSANIPSQLPSGESFRSAAEIISQFGGFIEGFNLRPTDPYYGFGKGSDIRSFVKGSGGVTINVNGTVIDPEGAARAISDVLTRGAARAGNLPTSTIWGIE